MSLSIYLGANTVDGFYSYFEVFTKHVKKLYIIKGGPGSGKSTMMKKISKFTEDSGLETINIYCSSDLQSLDGVYIPKYSIMYVDGTAPHVLEAKTPGACEEYIDFGQCFNTERLSLYRDEIEAENVVLSHWYSECYSYLAAAGEVKRCTDALYRTDRSRLIHQAQRLAKRTLLPSDGDGCRYDIFLGSFTSNGLETLHDLKNYNFYPIWDPYSNAGALLEHLAEIAVSYGYKVYAAHDPYDPSGDPMHLLIPELSIAYVTQARTFGFDNILGNRRIRIELIDDIYAKKIQRRNIRIIKELENCAVMSLANAKKVHDKLEDIYHPHVDFTHVDELTASHIDMISNVINKT